MQSLQLWFLDFAFLQRQWNLKIFWQRHRKNRAVLLHLVATLNFKSASSSSTSLGPWSSLQCSGQTGRSEIFLCGFWESPRLALKVHSSQYFCRRRCSRRPTRTESPFHPCCPQCQPMSYRPSLLRRTSGTCPCIFVVSQLFSFEDLQQGHFVQRNIRHVLCFCGR